uniref:DN40292_c0_g3_i1 n=1 Tax=Ceratitis capitata TaxID=7213 RepID=A0A5B8HDM7_CERCA|nr:MOY [Ceratitis capitata]QED12496.1 DN40292_c0_g3_i1 [Ceratitis capitata]
MDIGNISSKNTISLITIKYNSRTIKVITSKSRGMEPKFWGKMEIAMTENYFVEEKPLVYNFAIEYRKLMS